MRRVLRGAPVRTFVVQPRPPKRRLLELTLVRHGQSEGNLAYRRAGQGDDSLYDGAFMDRHSSLWRLTDRGRREARAAGETVCDAILRSRSVGKRKILRPGGGSWSII